MIASEKSQSEIMALLVAFVLIFVVLGRYSKQALEWVLMKLYEIFVQQG